MLKILDDLDERRSISFKLRNPLKMLFSLFRIFFYFNSKYKTSSYLLHSYACNCFSLFIIPSSHFHSFFLSVVFLVVYVQQMHFLMCFLILEGNIVIGILIVSVTQIVLIRIYTVCISCYRARWLSRLISFIV